MVECWSGGGGMVKMVKLWNGRSEKRPRKVCLNRVSHSIF